MKGLLARAPLARLRRQWRRPRGEDFPPAVRRYLRLRPPSRKTPIGEVDFVAFDTELTGLEPRRDSIISIGAVKLRGSRILPGETFYRLVRPATELKREGVVIHELTHSDLEAAHEPAEVVAELLELIGGTVLIGHFVHIDTAFLGRAMKRCFGVKLNNPAVDTAVVHDWLTDNEPAWARHHGGISAKQDLFSMAARYGITVDKAHDAFSDAYVTAQLFQRFCYFLHQGGVKTLKDLLSVGR